jgi:hypothetical protein
VTVTPTTGDAGDISVTATFTSGCAASTSDPVRLTRQLSAANAIAVSPNVTCLAPTTSYTLSVTAPPANAQYVWTLPAGWSGTSTGSSIAVTTGTAGGTVSVRTSTCATGGISQAFTVNGPNGCTPTILDLGCGTYRATGTSCIGSGNTYTWSVTGAASGNQGPFNTSGTTFIFPAAYSNGTVNLVITNTTTCLSATTFLGSQSYTPGPPFCRPAPPTPSNPGGPVKDIDEAAQLRAFPNPTAGQLDVTLSTLTSGSTSLSLLDVTGRVRLQHTTADQTTRFDVRTLPEGQYVLRAVLPNGQVLTQKVQVSR